MNSKDVYPQEEEASMKEDKRNCLVIHSNENKEQETNLFKGCLCLVDDDRVRLIGSNFEVIIMHVPAGNCQGIIMTLHVIPVQCT